MVNDKHHQIESGAGSHYLILAVHILLVALAFTLTLILIRPGYFDLTTPVHSDLYSYFLTSGRRFLLADWLQPRSVMLAALRLFGASGSPSDLFFTLSLLAPTLVVIATYAMGYAFGERNALATVLACITVFSSPHYLSIAQLDVGGVLSGIFAIFAGGIYLWHVKHGRDLSSIAWLSIVLFMALSVESKWTFVVSVPVLILGFWYQSRRKDALLLLAVVVALTAASVAKDWFMKSPFVRTDVAGDVYSFAIDPLRNLGALALYLRQAVTIPLAIAIAIACGLCFVAGRMFAAIALLVAGVAAAVPMSAIPNRQMEMYAWYSTFFFALVIWLGVVKSSTRQMKLAVGAITVLVLWHGYVESVHTEWNVNVQRYNRNLMEGLSQLDSSIKQPVLIAGVRGPYHPLRNTAYTEQRFPAVRGGSVLLVEAERPWNAGSSELRNGLYASQVAIESFGSIVTVLPDGRVARVFDVDSVRNADPVILMPSLLCHASGVLSATANLGTIAEVVKCLAEAGEGSIALALARRFPNRKDMPWIDFFLGKALLAQGDRAEAEIAFAAALSVEPSNQIFRGAVDGLRQRRE